MFKADAIGLLVTVFLIAVVAGQRVLSLLLGLLFLALFVADRWSRWALRRVDYERSLSQPRAFVDDTITLTIRVSNRKPLPLPRLQCADLAPSKLDYGRPLRPAGQPNAGMLERGVALRAYDAATWRIEGRCTQRGLFSFGPVELTASDPFGLYHSSIRLDTVTRLVVYPRLAHLPDFTLAPQQLLGDRRAPHRLLTDPMRTVGIRDYQPTDPFKTIHWAASARRGALQTRILEPTATLELVIVLDLDTFEQYWQGIQVDLLEYLISVAATVATAAEEGRWSFGIYANAGAADSDHLVHILPSRSPAQLSLVLEALAKLVPYSVVGLPFLLRRIGGSIPQGATVIVISAVASVEVQTALLNLAAPRGYPSRRIRWLYAGQGDLPAVPHVEVQALPIEANWQAPRTPAVHVS